MLLLLLLAALGHVTASYRKFGFLNHDICPEVGTQCKGT
jgi:hypothetical protein